MFYLAVLLPKYYLKNFLPMNIHPSLDICDIFFTQDFFICGKHPPHPAFTWTFIYDFHLSGLILRDSFFFISIIDNYYF